MTFSLQTILMVALGGGVGALARYWLGRLALQVLGSGFPYGTLIVNLLGSLLMGLVAAWLVSRGSDSERLQPLLVVGFLGSFTTFSTFSLDLVRMLEVGRLSDAALYMLMSVIVGVVALMAGMMLGRALLGS